MYSQYHADRVKDFISHLTHTKGQWAGQSFELLDWQREEVINPLFGTLKKNGLRQYRTCYVEIPKKNGKTELGAAVALYMLCADREAAPEVYSAAADREQAGLIYQVAAQMVRSNSTLSKRLKILDSRKRIINYSNNGFYQVLSSDVKTKHGLNPSCVLFDEIHAQPNDELWRVLTSGTDYARQQQVVFVMTTAGVYNKESIWWRTREKARQIKEGIIQDDSFLPVLYIADLEKDDPGDPEVWRRVNPSIDVIFPEERVYIDYKTAKNDPVEFADFKRFRCNIPIKQLSKWLPMEAWDTCSTLDYPDEDQLEGKVCCGGIDLSSTIDLTAFVLVFPPKEPDGVWHIKPYCYCPLDTITERSRSDKVHYDIWKKQGFITATPGNYVDYAFVKKDILETAKKYDLREVGYDPYGANQLAGELYNNHAIKMIEVRQGAKTLSEPSKDILKKTLAHKISHGGHPVLRWCADNVVMVPDANENIRPAKDKAVERIDVFVAMITAWSRAMNCSESVYEGRGVNVFE